MNAHVVSQAGRPDKGLRATKNRAVVPQLSGEDRASILLALRTGKHHALVSHRLEQGHAGILLSVALMLLSVALGIILFSAELTPPSSPSPLRDNMVSTAKTTVGIMKNLIGAGILCLPKAAAEMSVVGFSIGMVFCCLCSLSSFLLIGFACNQVNASSYAELMVAAFGETYGNKRIASRMNVVLFLHTFGGCIACMTIIADVSAKLVHDSFTMADLTLRATCSTSIALVLLLPLCMHDQLKSLSITSWLGIIVMVLVAGFCVRDCVVDWTSAQSTKLIASNLFTLRMSFFKAVPLINGAYIAHYNAPTFLAEVEGQSLFTYAIAAILAHVLVSLLYFSVAFAGFARFGNTVNGNVLTSYEGSGHGWVQICWLCVLLNMVFTVPFLFQRSRASWMSIFEAKLEDCAYFALTLSLLVCIVICGIFFQHLDHVMLCREATIGMLLMYIFPAVISLKLLDSQGIGWSTFCSANACRYYLCVVLVVAGTGSSIAGLTSMIVQWS